VRNALAALMKKAAGTYDRAVPFAQTLALVPELRARYGITRVADTTRLDRTGIPTFSAMVPRSPDMLGVYNGKGLTCEAAIVSAVMEAVERQIGAAVRLPVFRESIGRVCERLDIAALGALANAVNGDAECVHGMELFSGDSIPVPLAMVQCPWRGERLFKVTSTNGLASGNNRTEAIYHALCELIERHTWSLYHVRGAFAPRAFAGAGAANIAVAPEIILPTGDRVVDELVEKLGAAGLSVRAFCLTDGALPVTMVVSVCEPASDPPMVHMGLGCSLSPTHALVRGLTEAAQSRVTDIQAAREDILRPDEDAGRMLDHGRRPTTFPYNEWYFDLPSYRLALRDIPDRVSDDLDADVRTTIEAMQQSGVSSIAIVDLSPNDLPISVVRAVAPGLETLMFSGVLGPRARAWLNPFAV
jgi:YcaO-like protein with predicted kinase domain